MLEPRACPSSPPLPIPDTSSGGYSCAVKADTFRRFSNCCWNYGVNYQASDHCFEWCHTYEDWYRYTQLLTIGNYDVGNATGLNGTERLRQSMIKCLAVDGDTVPDEAIACQANSKDNVPAGYNFLGPNNQTACPDQHPSGGVGGIIPKSPPSCGVRYNLDASGNPIGTNAFDTCCDWAPRMTSSGGKCFEYCYLPKGNSFRGKGNLTDLEAVDSFKRCLLGRGINGSALDGVYCQWNETMRDLNAHNITTSAYLLGGGGRAAPRLSWAAMSSVVSLVLLSLIAV